MAGLQREKSELKQRVQSLEEVEAYDITVSCVVDYFSLLYSL